MKTDDLISLLSKDAAVPQSVRTAILCWLPLGIAASCLGFALFLGFRTHLGNGVVVMAVGMKIVAGLLLASTGCFAMLNMANPEASVKQHARWLLLAPAFLAAFVILDLLTVGLSGFPARVVGMSVLRCLVVIPLLAALPLTAMLIALRNGATPSPTIAGAVAGLTAAGLAAGIYAFNCSEDSPLFVFAWYGLATLVLAGIGAFAGRRVLAW